MANGDNGHKRQTNLKCKEIKYLLRWEPSIQSRTIPPFDHWGSGHSSTRGLNLIILGQDMLWCRVVKREHSGPKCTLIQSFYWVEPPKPHPNPPIPSLPAATTTFNWTSHISRLAQSSWAEGIPGKASDSPLFFIVKVNNTEITQTGVSRSVSAETNATSYLLVYV